MKINNYNHLENLIGSINKMLINAKNKGVIQNKEISLLNLIYKLISKNCSNVNNTTSQEKDLINLYYKLLNKYNILCKSELKKFYNFTLPNINPTIVANCADYSSSTIKEIFYWQEEDYNTSSGFVTDEITTDNFLNSKLSDTYENFALGKNITYNNIGRICFFMTESETINFEIRDALNNVINNQFTMINIPTMNGKLFVSRNIISFGNINFKITKA